MEEMGEMGKEERLGGLLMRHGQRQINLNDEASVYGNGK